MADMGNIQASSEQATRNGIQALEAAFTGIMRARSDVDGTRANLSQGYQGSDGGAFGQLLQQWDEQANVILKNLEDMIDKLNTSLAEHGKQQGASNESINQAFQSSEAAFQALAG
ncbi:hypothetical protein GCM10018793_35190 [Streptomyces sulfonofaciens]|uniref:ESAT-6-like protein n=2 Tax=Streptomyces sulfonofaciens TaxID=68272 RepID=A0A919L1C9_9ACTN|nr:WXG100 family type VII secretion target [Streptomyces sulfonofaciens]GHH80308.1 hypothetical protein GCM10018793_35190 [Streptomyces sulfonofaciens]